MRVRQKWENTRKYGHLPYTDGAGGSVRIVGRVAIQGLRGRARNRETGNLNRW